METRKMETYPRVTLRSGAYGRRHEAPGFKWRKRTMIIVRKTARFTLWSQGNGLIYALAHRASGKDIFFQGDDAIIFEQELDDAENAEPTRDTDDILASLWSTYAA
jgi:hypothetical protein